MRLFSNWICRSKEKVSFLIKFNVNIWHLLNSELYNVNLCIQQSLRPRVFCHGVFTKFLDPQICGTLAPFLFWGAFLLYHLKIIVFTVENLYGNDMHSVRRTMLLGWGGRNIIVNFSGNGNKFRKRL